MTLVARDEAEQEGRSEPVELTLPARQFSNPLARAVVEQRAKLAMDANAAPVVGDALDALTLAPEDTYDKVGDYLALRSAYFRLQNARNDDDLRDVVDYLWSVALGIEDGDLSLAAQALRDAQEALRQALENGASDEEIARLTDGASPGDAGVPAGAGRGGAAQPQHGQPAAEPRHPDAPLAGPRTDARPDREPRRRTAPATPPASCFPSCRTCWRTSRPDARCRATSRPASR